MPAAILPDDLIAAGYRRFTDELRSSATSSGYLGTYQKLISDEKGRKYFINVDHFQRSTPHRIIDVMEPHCQFRRGDTHVNVQMLLADETIRDVEDFFEHMWRAMRFDYYEISPRCLAQGGSIGGNADTGVMPPGASS